MRSSCNRTDINLLIFPFIQGYGHVTPLSEAGKIFCIIYATVGIPLTLVLISAVVERLLIPTNWILGKLNSKLGHLYQPFNIRLLHLAIICLLQNLFYENQKSEFSMNLQLQFSP